MRSVLWESEKLVYSPSFRAEDENGGQTIRSHMFENTVLLDPELFAGGRYSFRIVASRRTVERRRSLRSGRS